MIALLGSRISMNKRMEPAFFGGVTIGDNHGVGSPTGTRSIVSSLRSRCSLFINLRSHVERDFPGFCLHIFPIPFVRPGYSSSHSELILFTISLVLTPEFC